MFIFIYITGILATFNKYIQFACIDSVRGQKVLALDTNQ